MRGTVVFAGIVLLMGCASEPSAPPAGSEDAAVDAGVDHVAFPECFLPQCDGGKQYCPPGVICSLNGSDCSWCSCHYNSISDRYYMGCSGPCAGECPVLDAGAQ